MSNRCVRVPPLVTPSWGRPGRGGGPPVARPRGMGVVACQLTPSSRSAKISQGGPCERRRSTVTSPVKTLRPRPRGFARGVSVAGGRGGRFRFLPWGRLRLDGTTLRGVLGSMPSRNSVASQPGATTSSRGDPCGKGVWSGGVSGSPIAPPSSRRHRGGLLVGVAARWYCHHLQSRLAGPPAVGRVSTGAQGEIYTARVRHTLDGRGLASGGRLAGGLAHMASARCRRGEPVRWRWLGQRSTTRTTLHKVSRTAGCQAT